MWMWLRKRLGLDRIEAQLDELLRLLKADADNVDDGPQSWDD